MWRKPGFGEGEGKTKQAKEDGAGREIDPRAATIGYDAPTSFLEETLNNSDEYFQ